MFSNRTVQDSPNNIVIYIYSEIILLDMLLVLLQQTTIKK